MQSILEEAIELTTRTRQGSYGHPYDHFSRTVGAINAQFTDIVQRRLAEGKPMFEPADWARFMVLDKIARSLGSYKRDNMVDVAGYANTHELVVEREAEIAARGEGL